MTQYYVRTDGSNSNNGLTNSAGGAWLTISYAGSQVVAGDTVNVADGVYNGAVVTNNSGTSGNRITYRSINKWGAQIVRNVALASGTMVWRNWGDYVTIDGFDITGTCAVGLMHSGSQCWAINNHVHHIIALCDGFGGAGVGFDQYNVEIGGLADSNLVHDIGPWNTNCFRVQGVYTSIPQVTISNNIIYRVIGYGITQGHCSYSVIMVNNTVFNCGYPANEGGGAVITGNTNCALASNNNVFANNIIYDCVIGVHEEGVTAADTTNYTNNLVFGCSRNNWGAMTMAHVNDINAIPGFVFYDRDGAGDYHLTSGSASRNAGTSLSAPALDFDGVARPQEASVDLGAYEYVATGSGSGTLVGKVSSSGLGSTGFNVSVSL
jgi:hypothetical protein